jgi:hypothetical protein
MMTKQSFADACASTVGEYLAGAGYLLHGVYSRPLGIVAEFRKNEDLMLIACEGNVLHADLIIKSSKYGWCRIDLNQAIWHEGDRTMLSCADCRAQLQFLASKLNSTCSRFFKSDSFTPDPRFCFVMSDSDRSTYLKAQFEA